MKMNIVKLRRLIREEIESALNGQEMSSEQSHPQTFSEFRLWFGDLLEQAQAPEDLIEVVKDLDKTDNMLIEQMMSAWLDLVSETAGVPDPMEVAKLFTHYSIEVSQDIGLNESIVEKIGKILQG